MKNIGVYPGSFDPITEGHMDIIRRARKMCDELIVAVVGNPAKGHGCFPVSERLNMIRRACADLPNVSVDSFDGLTVDFAKARGAKVMIRGLRSIGDFESEKILAQINLTLAPDIETVFLVCLPEHTIVSSSAVRELASFGGSLAGYVPACIEDDVKKHFAKE